MAFDKINGTQAIITLLYIERAKIRGLTVEDFIDIERQILGWIRAKLKNWETACPDVQNIEQLITDLEQVRSEYEVEADGSPYYIDMRSDLKSRIDKIDDDVKIIIDKYGDIDKTAIASGEAPIIEGVLRPRSET